MSYLTVFVCGVVFAANSITLASAAADIPKSVVVTSILEEPFLMKSQSSDQSAQVYEGYCADLIRLIADQLGFNYTIRLVRDGKYGVQNADGTWSGMIGELIREEADLAVAPLVITSQRERVVDFTKPFMSTGISIMMKKPIKQMLWPPVFVFLYPFSAGVWVCLLVACLVVGSLLFANARFNSAEKQQNTAVGTPTDGSTQLTFRNSLWYSVRSMLQQGTNTELRSISGRMLSVVWWFFVIVVIALYIAVSVSMILSYDRSAMLTPIESVEDLAKQNEIKYGTVQSGATKEFFRVSTIPTYAKMWETMSKDPSVFVSNYTEGIERVRSSEGNYALLLESSVNDYVSRQPPCDTMKVGQNLDSKGYGIATKIKSPLRDRLSLAVLELLESGKLSELENKWWMESNQCPTPAKEKSRKVFASEFQVEQLQMHSLAGLILVLLGGIILSAVVAILEHFYYIRKATKGPQV